MWKTSGVIKMFHIWIWWWHWCIIGKGLLNDDGEPLNPELLKGMPIGVVNEIYKQVADISGIREDKEEQYRLTRELMGF